jgi:integrase
MAALVNPKDRGFFVRVTSRDGKPDRITLPKFKGKPQEKKREAEQFRYRIAELEKLHRDGGEASSTLNAWLEELSPTMLNRLSRYGLIEVGESDTPTVGQLVEKFLKERTDVKESTRLKYKQAANALLEFFPESQMLDDVTEGHALEFRRFLQSLKKKNGEPRLAENTIRKRCGDASLMFSMAVDYRWIKSNPFKVLPVSTKRTPQKTFITHEMYAAVLAACPNAEWKLLVALSRFGGLRVPSEPLSMRLIDVDWERNEIHVPSPKTEHHEGKEHRTIPLWDELRQPLLDVFELAETGTEFLINKARPEKIRGIDPKKVNWTLINLGTTLTKIVKRSGLTPWKKVWHSMRASCQTELEDHFASHIVCGWLGNTEGVAKKHYLQTTADHHCRAIELKRFKNGTEFGTATTKNGTEIGTHATPHGTTRINHEVGYPSEKSTKTAHRLAVSGGPKMGDTGLEPVTSTV